MASVSSGIVELENKTESIVVHIWYTTDIKLWKVFTDKLSHNVTIKKLTINCRNSNFHYDSHILFIIECLSMAITTNNTLQYLRIWGKKLVMDSQCYKILANGIRYNKSIRTLLLWSFHTLDIDGIGYISEALQYNTNIKQLQLNDCKLGNDATCYILNY